MLGLRGGALPNDRRDASVVRMIGAKRVSGCVRLPGVPAGPDLVQQVAECRGGYGEVSAIGVLAVADADRAGELRDLHALATVGTAAGGLAPGGAVHVHVC